MATDPRIRYDIAATASGAADVERLAREFEQLDGAFPEDLAGKVRQASQQLEQLGQQQAAVEAFTRIKTETEQARRALEDAQAAAQKFGAELAQTESPTRAQAGQLQKLRDSVKAAKDELLRQTEALDQARAGLTRFGISGEQVGQRSTALRQEVAQVRSELERLGEAGTAGVAFQKLIAATEDARVAFLNAETELSAFQAKIAGVDEPTATQALALRRLNERLEETRAALNSATQAQQAGAQSFANAGGLIDEFTASVIESKRAALDSAAASRADAQASLQRAEAAAQAARARVAAEREAQAAANSSEAVFARLVQETDAARTRMEQTAKAAKDLAGELTAVQRPTDGEAAKLRELRAAAESARADFQRLQTATVDQGLALRQAGVNTELLTAKARESATAQQQAATSAQRVTNAYAEQGAAAIKSAQQQATATTSVRGSLEGIAGQLRTIQTLAATVFGGQILGGQLGELARTADAYANLQARIKLVTGEGALLQESFAGVFEVAQRTNTAVESTGTLFTRIAQAQRDLGASSSEAAATALALTETINQAIQVSGGSAESADAAVTQLIQALQSGVLRGEEFNSVMEQAPRLARALADGLGVTTGELRKLAEAGTLTSQTVITALRGQSAALQREFEQLPPTVGRALQTLSNEWTRYVGEVDKANGISRTAAEAITALARNLDAVGTALTVAGKAVAAYIAIDLAKSLYARAAAAAAASAAQAKETTTTVAATVAVAANTTALAANTAAKAANTAAAGASAVAWGTLEKNVRLGGAASAEAAKSTGALGAALGLLRGAGAGALAAIGGLPTVLLAVILNARELGTWIGEAAAKMLGAKDRSNELAEADRRLAEEAKKASTAKQEQAQKSQLAAEAARGLTKDSKELVAQFDEVKKKGGSAADALSKVEKSLNFRDIKGIQDGIAALEELRLRGEISADAVRESISKGLNGIDLGVFRTNALAAFNDSVFGAERLRLSLDAIQKESLRRVGTSVEELRTGFSATFNSAINDIDAVRTSLTELGISGEKASLAIGKALDNATVAAGTKEAVDDVIARIKALGEQGLLSGKQLEDSFVKAAQKAIEFANTDRDLRKVEEQIKAIIAANPEMARGFDSALETLKRKVIEVTPYLRQLEDDAKQLGVTLSDSSKKGVEETIRAYERLKLSGKASTAELQTAFVNLAKKAIEAAGGQIPEWVKVEAALRGVTVGTDAAGQAFVQMGNSATTAFQAAQQGAQSVVASLSSITDAARKAQGSLSTLGSNTYDNQNFATDANGQRINITGQLDIPAGYTLDTQAFLRAQQSAAQSGLAAPDPKNFIVPMSPGLQANPESVYGQYAGQPGYGSSGYSPFSPAAQAAKKTPAPPAPAPAPAPKQGSSAGGTFAAAPQQVTININGQRAATVNVASSADVAALESALRALTAGQRSTGQAAGGY